MQKLAEKVRILSKLLHLCNGLSFLSILCADNPYAGYINILVSNGLYILHFHSYLYQIELVTHPGQDIVWICLYTEPVTFTPHCLSVV